MPGITVWTNDACDCEWQLNLQLHYLLAGIPPEYWRLSFREFFGDRDARDAAESYLANWRHNRDNGIGIRFFSPFVGVGKTTLACLIAKEIAKKKASRPQVQFIHFNDTLGLYQMPYEEREPFVRRLRSIPVLILDEVNTAISDYQQEYYAAELEALIRYRVNGNAITIITTNMKNDRLEEVYPKTFSLLSHRQEDVYVDRVDLSKAGYTATDDAEDESDARKLLGTNGNKKLKPIV